MDKDILLRGNKIYSEDICVFVPQRVNTLLIKSTAKRGRYLLGVYFDATKQKFTAQCNTEGKIKRLGCYKTEEDAYQAYKTFKEGYIKEVANEYKNQLDPRTYEALLLYKVEKED